MNSSLLNCCLNLTVIHKSVKCYFYQTIFCFEFTCVFCCYIVQINKKTPKPADFGWFKN